MNLNTEAIDEMIVRRDQIEAGISTMRQMQICYPNCWNLMLTINARVAELKIERKCIDQMLIDEYMEKDIDAILLELHLR